MRKHVKAGSQLDDLRRQNRELSSLRSSGVSDESDDVSSADTTVNVSEGLLSSVVLGVSEHLETMHDSV